MACNEGHLFCKSCIDQWVNVYGRTTCPEGRQPLLAGNLRNIIAFDAVVDGLRIFCRRREFGCTWTGPFQYSRYHEDSCLYEEVGCTHLGCKQMVMRGQLTRHMDVCEMRPATCQHCDTAMPSRLQANHQRYACRRASTACMPVQLRQFNDSSVSKRQAI